MICILIFFNCQRELSSYMTIHDRIKQLREESRLSQYEMADRLGISQSTYLQIEKGKTELTVSRMLQICKVLGVGPDNLLGDDAETKQSERQSRLEEQLSSSEALLKEKMKTVKFLTHVLEWVSEKFRVEFAAFTNGVAGVLNVGTISNGDIGKYEFGYYSFSESDLRIIGDYMFNEEPFMPVYAQFMASSGFITEKWFIDAYKRHARRTKERVSPSEAIGFIQGALELVKEDQ